jgi:hypothetical protein
MFPAILGTTELSVPYAIPERGELLPIAPVVCRLAMRAIAICRRTKVICPTGVLRCGLSSPLAKYSGFPKALAPREATCGCLKSGTRTAGRRDMSFRKPAVFGRCETRSDKSRHDSATACGNATLHAPASLSFRRVSRSFFNHCENPYVVNRTYTSPRASHGRVDARTPV